VDGQVLNVPAQAEPPAARTPGNAVPRIVQVPAARHQCVPEPSKGRAQDREPRRRHHRCGAHAARCCGRQVSLAAAGARHRGFGKRPDGTATMTINLAVPHTG